MDSLLTIGNPKRQPSAQSGWADLFPYYAGYPEEFAKEVLRSASLKRDARIFDPWNGSGSTTTAAAALGLKAIGFDLNPVMTIVARARVLPISEWPSLRPLSRRIIQHARSLNGSASADPLAGWFDMETAAHLRSLERSIREHLVDMGPAGLGTAAMSSLASAFYVALFSAARSLTLTFRASNPTWMRVAKQSEELLRYSKADIERRFLDAVERARASCNAGSLEAKDGDRIKIETSDSTFARPRKNSIDFILTSPPYCTRIDYTSMTRVELAILSELYPVERRQLSAKMLGSIRVPKSFPRRSRQWGSTAIDFLRRVRDHPSHASDTYYLKSHLDYFSKLHKSLRTSAEALKPGGRALFVVQDSIYKGNHNNLQAAVTEIAINLGLEPIQREDFAFARSMRDVNTRALAYGVSGKVTESALVFQKPVTANTGRG